MMQAIAGWSCTNIIRESALKADSGRKIPHHTRELNPNQSSTWLFGPTFTQLSCSALLCNQPPHGPVSKRILNWLKQILALAATDTSIHPAYNYNANGASTLAAKHCDTPVIICHCVSDRVDKHCHFLEALQQRSKQELNGTGPSGPVLTRK